MKNQKQSRVEGLWVVRNFRQVIEKRDMGLMKDELYQFLSLHCGFIAHNNIDGFRATYAYVDNFANVFISHFDKDHRYFNRVYSCDEEPYKNTGFTKADIKKEFYRIVEGHKKAIRSWAEEKRRQDRYRLYSTLKKEFEEEYSIPINCDACGNSYSVSVIQDDQHITDFAEICCVFCGRVIKNTEVDKHVERTECKAA